MKRNILVVAFIITLVCVSAHARPQLFVEATGINPGGNREWLVSVAPDPSLFSGSPPTGPGGSIAVELDFTILGSNLLGVTKDAALWPADNPGNNPFTMGITDGVNISPGNRFFASLGSGIFTSGDPMPLLMFQTGGSGVTTVNFGGSMFNFFGRIAQGGMNFDGYTGSVTAVPEPSSVLLVAVALGAVGWGRRRVG